MSARYRAGRQLDQHVVARALDGVDEGPQGGPRRVLAERLEGRRLEPPGAAFAHQADPFAFAEQHLGPGGPGGGVFAQRTPGAAGVRGGAPASAGETRSPRPACGRSPTSADRRWPSPRVRAPLRTVPALPPGRRPARRSRRPAGRHAAGANRAHQGEASAAGRADRAQLDGEGVRVLDVVVGPAPTLDPDEGGTVARRPRRPAVRAVRAGRHRPAAVAGRPASAARAPRSVRREGVRSTTSIASRRAPHSERSPRRPDRENR